MTNYKYLKKNNLFEAHMKFMRAIGEAYGYPLEEADDEPGNEEQGQGQIGGGPGGGASSGDPMGGPGGGAPGGGMPSPEEMENGQMGGGAPGGDPMGGGAPGGGMPGDDPMGGGAPDGDPMGGMPGDGSMGGGMPGDGSMGGEPEEDENVIDVDDLTKAQEKVNDKVNSVGRDLGKVDDRIEKLIGAVETLKNMFDRNNQEISDLKAEFEKRNPTQTEKLNLRSLDSYPFKIKPTDYWADKSANSNYSAYADNEEPTTHEYVITNNDVDDFNEREIADSFNIEDKLQQDIKRIFNLS